MLDWKDGQPYSSDFGDVYFSSASGLGEKRHVFLAGNGLAERFAALHSRSSFCIGETGFGTGLNFLCAWDLFTRIAPAAASLDYFSVEKYPLDDGELAKALALWTELQPLGERLRARWRRRVPGWNRWSFAGGRVRLTLAWEDVSEALPELPGGCVDAWFLDGFAPTRNPEMWSEPVLNGVARASRAGATLATYTSAGWVRRGLEQAGFEVERVPGFAGKREMTRGWLKVSRCEGALASGNAQPADPVKSPTAAAPSRPRTAIVIGGGIAGAASARALAERGVAVTLVERASRLATAGSGNPRGMLHARLGASGNALQRLVLAAYGHALAMFDDVLPVGAAFDLVDAPTGGRSPSVGGTLRSECGLLELAWCDKEQTRIDRLGALGWPAHLLRPVDVAEASVLAGVPMRHGGLWLPAGGWLQPPEAVARLAAHAGITLLLGHEALTLERAEDAEGVAGENRSARSTTIDAGGCSDVPDRACKDVNWRVGGADVDGKRWTRHADVVVVCCAHVATRLAPMAAFPLTPVRGQISVVPATAASSGLRAVICGDGYVAPAVDGVHVLGATHGFEDEAIDVRAADHAANLECVASYAPELRSALGQVDCATLEGRASVRCSAPGATPFVGRVQDGLYCSLAHGTRGLITAGIAAEVIAAEIRTELPPLPQSILDALAPIPRLERLARKQGSARGSG